MNVEERINAIEPELTDVQYVKFLQLLREFGEYIQDIDIDFEAEGWNADVQIGSDKRLEAQRSRMDSALGGKDE